MKDDSDAYATPSRSWREQMGDHWQDPSSHGFNEIQQEDPLHVIQQPDYDVDVIIERDLMAARSPMSVSDMILAVSGEMHRILGSQRARILAGFIQKPDAEEINRAAMLADVVDFLDLCAENPDRPLSWAQRRRGLRMLTSLNPQFDR